MALTAGTAYVDIRPDLSSFGRRLNSGVNSQTRTMGSRMKSTGAFLGKSLAIGAGAAIAGAAILGKFAVEAAIEAQRVQAQTAAALKSTGGVANVTAREVENLALKIQNYSGISDEAVASGENMLLTFTNIRNEAGKNNDIFNQATTAAADLATRMNGGLTPSAEQLTQANLQLGKALNDPIAGMGALGRIGVKFTDETKERITALVEEGKTMQAQKIILKEMTTEFGGSARAMGKTAEGQFNIAKEAVGNVMEEIGGALLPTIAKLGKAIAKFVGSKEFQAWMKDAARVIKNFAADVIRVAGGLFGWISRNTDTIKTFAKIIGGVLAVALGVKLVLAINKAVLAFQTASAIMMAHPFVLIGVAVAALAILIITNWDKIKKATQAIWKPMVPFFKAIWNAIKKIVSVAFNIMKTIFKVGLAVMTGNWSAAWNAIKKALGAAWTIIKNVTSAAFDAVKEVFGSALTALKNVWTGAWNGIKNFLGRVWNAIKDAVRNGVNAAANFFRSLPGKIMSFLAGLPKRMLDFGRLIIEKLIEGIKDVVGGVKDAVTGAFDFDVQYPGFSQGGAGFGADGPGFFGGNVPGGYPNGTPGGMAEAAMAAVPGMQMFSSQRRPNDAGSYHSLPWPHNAVDVSGAQVNGVFVAGNAIAGYLLNRFGAGAFRELIHTPLGFSINDGRITPAYAQADHYDHVHVADQGGTFRGPGLVGIGAGVDEAVFQPAKKISGLSGGRGEVHLHGDFRLPGEYVRALDWYDRTRSW